MILEMTSHHHYLYNRSKTSNHAQNMTPKRKGEHLKCKKIDPVKWEGNTLIVQDKFDAAASIDPQ